MTPEKRVQNQIMTWLNQLKADGHPIRIERRQAGGFSYKMGDPDLWCVYNGIHIEIEVKREKGGELSVMQEKKIEIFNSINCPYILASSVDDVKDFFEKYIF